jgi:HlyD family secretion protein
MIPNSALRFIPKDLSQGDYDNNSGPCVWIIDQDKIVPVKLTIGIDDYNYTELVSGNLHEGQDVVVGLKKKKD